MNSNKNNVSTNNLDEDIDKLSKNLYLESPDLWIEFTDKIGDKIFDEMVLFFAAKYNHLSIIKHAVNNDFINLKSPSKNRDFSTIIQHLMSAAMQNNSDEVYSYLKNIITEGSTNSNVNDYIIKDEADKNQNLIEISEDISIKNDINQDKYIPEFLCPKCNTNIFNSGYSSYENVVYKFSTEESKSVEVSRKQLNEVICCNCSTKIGGTSIQNLNDLCIIQNCNKCGSDLTVCGIVDKAKMMFNKELNKFTPTSTSYHCANCSNVIDEKQKEHFSL